MSYYFEEDKLRKKRRYTLLFSILFLIGYYNSITNYYKYFSFVFYCSVLLSFISYIILTSYYLPFEVKNNKKPLNFFLYLILLFFLTFFALYLKDKYKDYRLRKEPTVLNYAIVENKFSRRISRTTKRGLIINYYFSDRKYIQEAEDIELKRNYKKYKFGDTINIIHSIKDPELFEVRE